MGFEPMSPFGDQNRIRLKQIEQSEKTKLKVLGHTKNLFVYNKTGLKDLIEVVIKAES